jgi:hypothetical protein
MPIMKRQLIHTMAARLLGLALTASIPVTLAATSAKAQTTGAAENRWRIGASMGAYVPLSSVIVAADTHDTHLEAGPAFSLDARYLAANSIAVFANGTLAFGTIQLGSSIQPTVLGPTDQVMLGVGSAGVLLSPDNWPGENLQPTLRLGGGFKWYSFDITGAENQFRPTGDVGLGFRGIGIGSIDVTAEVRYLLSSFDQAKLPTRGIAAQDQRQNDLIFAIGFGIRP